MLLLIKVKLHVIVYKNRLLQIGIFASKNQFSVMAYGQEVKLDFKRDKFFYGAQIA